MAILYSHRQFGRAVFVMALGVAVLLGSLVPLVATRSARGHTSPALWVAAILPAVLGAGMLLMFSSLRVTVTDDRLAWAFGPGFPNYSARIAEIQRVEVVKTSLIYGIGIRITPRGWLYNVGPGSAVAVTTAKHTVLIGTDDAESLMRAISAARGGAAPSA